MSSTLRHPTVLCSLITTLCCLAPVFGTVQEPPLGEIVLDPSPVVVDLTNATLRIVAAESGEATLRWWRARPDEPGADELSATADAGAIVVERPAVEDGDALARLLVEITVAAGQQVSVNGSALDLRAERAMPEEPEIDQPEGGPDVVTAAFLEIQLVDSTVTLAGAGGITATFDRCTIDLHQTAGHHQLTLLDSILRIDDHTGNIDATGQGADVVVDKAQGQITVRGTGGSIDLRSTRGRFVVQAADALVQLVDVRGSGSATVTDSNIDLRDSALRKLQLKGTSSHATMSNYSGHTTVNFVGGSVTANDTTGDFTAIARNGATVDLTDLRGKVKLDLQQDSSADLRGIRGDVTATARGARLTIDGANAVAVNAAETQATLTAISKLASFQATDSDIELDLNECRDRAPTMAIGAGSTVRVRLGTPCRVAVKGTSSSLASQIDVTGCELRLGRGNRWSTKRVRGMDGKPPITLTAQVNPSAELIVEGRP